MQLGNLCYPAPINLLLALQNKIHRLRTFYYNLSNNSGKWRCPRRLAQLPLSSENPDHIDVAEEPVVAVFQGIAQLWRELLGIQLLLGQGLEKRFIHAALQEPQLAAGAGIERQEQGREVRLRLLDVDVALRVWKGGWTNTAPRESLDVQSTIVP